MTPVMSLLLTIVGVLIAIIGSLILLNLRSINKYISNLSARVDAQDKSIAEIKRDFARTVSKEDWVRSEAFTREKLDRLGNILSRMEGKLDIVEKIPQIAGSIAREIASQIKAGG